MSDPRLNDPRRPDYEAPLQPPPSPYADPAVDPRLSHEPVVDARGSRSGLVAAGILAVLLVIGVIAFTSTPSTDPGTTAAVPSQTEEMAPATPGATPINPAPTNPAPTNEVPATPAPAPAGEAPAADQ